MKQIIDKFVLKLKIFVPQKTILDCNEIIEKYIKDKGLFFKIYGVLLKLDNKKTNNLINTDTSRRKICRWQIHV